MQPISTPILLLTGYLGSGKTTLLNYILTNQMGIKFAVIVNDIGEVNIDAKWIEKGGIVGKRDESLVALQNGCICCTLKMDLIEQLNEIMQMKRFDYIVIEASGICEPEPIARTICSIPGMGPAFLKNGVPRLDCIVTVVDALRLQSEFDCGNRLAQPTIAEEDIENLIIQQIEFCNIVLLNKCSEVSPESLSRIRQIIRQLQVKAKIIECDYAQIDLREIIHTDRFRYEDVSTSAGWIQGIEKVIDEDEESHGDHHHEHGEEEHRHDHEHGHQHNHDCCHHHHHHEGETEEYGIGTFVYYRRQPFNLDLFDHYVATKWPRNVIRAKGVCYFSANTDMSYLFEQAGVQKKITEAGQWYATAPDEELCQIILAEPDLARDWDETYGDRMQKIVFIGQNLDKEQITKDLDYCLEENYKF